MQGQKGELDLLATCMRNLIFESAQDSRVQRFSNVQKIESTFFLEPFNNEHCTHLHQIIYKIIYCICPF